MPRNPLTLTLTAADVRAAMGRDSWVVFLPVKPEPEHVYGIGGLPPNEHLIVGEMKPCDVFGMSMHECGELFCPLGKPGDEVVGKEAWFYDADEYDHTLSSTRPFYRGSGTIFRADGYDNKPHGGWRSARTMPLWASRFRWTVSAVSVVRIQDVGEADAKLAGVEPTRPIYGDTGGWVREGHKEAFKPYWSARYSPEQWERNAWCWRVGLEART